MPIFSVCIVFKGAFFPYVDDNLAPNWLWLIFYDAVKNDTTWMGGGGGGAVAKNGESSGKKQNSP